MVARSSDFHENQPIVLKKLFTRYTYTQTHGLCVINERVYCLLKASLLSFSSFVVYMKNRQNIPPHARDLPDSSSLSGKTFYYLLSLSCSHYFFPFISNLFLNPSFFFPVLFSRSYVSILTSFLHRSFFSFLCVRITRDAPCIT
jgi:hypothetical protein